MIAFDWHKEVFKNTLTNIAKHARQYIGGFSLTGWYGWFEETYPEAFNKYQSVSAELNNLWGKADPESMDEFKKLAKQYEEAYKWAIDKYFEHLKLKDTQEGLL